MSHSGLSTLQSLIFCLLTSCRSLCLLTTVYFKKNLYDENWEMRLSMGKKDRNLWAYLLPCPFRNNSVSLFPGLYDKDSQKFLVQITLSGMYSTLSPVWKWLVTPVFGPLLHGQTNLMRSVVTVVHRFTDGKACWLLSSPNVVYRTFQVSTNFLSSCPMTQVCRVFSTRVLPSSFISQLKTMVIASNIILKLKVNSVLTPKAQYRSNISKMVFTHIETNRYWIACVLSLTILLLYCY